jgi:hypothetical protein
MKAITVTASTPREATDYVRRHVPALRTATLTVRPTIGDSSTFEVYA